MLKDLKAKCYEHKRVHDSCDGCHHKEQCAAYQDLSSTTSGLYWANYDPWMLTDDYVERFDELIAKIGGEQ